jgi:hypothetical protein
MALLERPATRDELLYYERRGRPPAESERTRIEGLLAGSDLIGGARGVLLAAVLGGIVLANLNWALISWALP